jgi:branched-chain amino acid transport system permease protein
VIGIPVLRMKLIAFASSSFIIGLAGALWAFAYLRTVEPNGFDLDRSFQILFIVIIGGLASLRGAFFGAALMVILPLLLARAGYAAFGATFNSGMLEMLQRMLIGALIVLFLILEPAGLTALCDRIGRRSTTARSSS